MAALTMKQAKASFEDACHFVATGKHLITGAAKFKERISHVIYQPKSLTYAEFAAHLARDLRVDKNEVKFVNAVEKKYNLKTRFNEKRDSIELYK
jgi:hypothetical protein